MEIKEYLIENKEKIMKILIFVLIAISLFTIGWVIYIFFFWEPEALIDPFKVNLSNLTG